MAVVYQTINSHGVEVKLCECTHQSGFSFALLVDGRIRSYFDQIRDAYREYNFNAR